MVTFKQLRETMKYKARRLSAGRVPGRRNNMASASVNTTHAGRGSLKGRQALNLANTLSRLFSKKK